MLSTALFFVKRLLHPLHYWTWFEVRRILPSRVNVLCLHAPLLLGVSLFLNLHHIHYHPCHGTKKLQWCLINADDYKGVALWLLTLIAFT